MLQYVRSTVFTHTPGTITPKMYDQQDEHACFTKTNTSTVYSFARQINFADNNYFLIADYTFMNNQLISMSVLV